MRGSLFPLFPLFGQDMGHQNRWNGTLSLFPLLPLRVKCQNHERVPISPISPILVANVYSSCQDMDHQNRGNRGNRDLSWFWHFTIWGNRGPLSVFPGWNAETMRGSLPLFWWPVSWQDDKTWTTKIGEIGEIGTLSWCWHFTLRGNRGNRDPLMVWALHPGKNAERVPISPILVAHVLTRWQDMDHQNRGNSGNRDPLMVLALHP